MDITEVRVKLLGNRGDRLRAFCWIMIGGEFVVRDIKVIEGTNGYFVAMPSRPMSDCCKKCGGKNHLKAKYCSSCGASLGSNRGKKDCKGRVKLYVDIAHPIKSECRRQLQDSIITAFKKELERSEQPGYKPAEMDMPDDDIPEVV